MTTDHLSAISPRIIIHGGTTGNVTRQNISPDYYRSRRNALLDILRDAYDKLGSPGANALDIATYAVSLLEDNSLFNAGHGAGFTAAGTHELEASVMVSRGYHKRGVGVMKVTKVKNPVKLAREVLIRGEETDGGGAQAHCQLAGETCDRLAQEWGLETVEPEYFWTRRRWDEHRRGLRKTQDDQTYARHKRQANLGSSYSNTEDDIDYSEPKIHEDGISIDETSLAWEKHPSLGTVGAVVLDSAGIICAATSTGGVTNKLPGRIGDTATLGSGFWAEEWQSPQFVPTLDYVSSAELDRSAHVKPVRAVGMSGTGNGDSFLRVCAVRTAAAMCRFGPTFVARPGHSPLQVAISAIAGPGGILQQSAEDRWMQTGEGRGGIIGIELINNQGKVVFDYNGGGMWVAWVDEDGKEIAEIFREEC